ncbi:response regulator (plasmid) [Sinorhizobium meliloti]|uniref:response regulator transcription factor n=1 Tax=Rhizobium meliloti TaxID=382 RepID=UPI0012955ECA|nr:response regulator [Sinorhizobium meliloti]
MKNSLGTVAVVDDDPSMRRSVERLLNAHGIMTEGYTTAESFLNEVQAGSIRCIVLDVHLGGMSGIELWHHLKQAGTDIPVVFMTAIEDEALEREAVAAGCIAYLRKPFPAEPLITAVKRSLALPSCD